MIGVGGYQAGVIASQSLTAFSFSSRVNPENLKTCKQPPSAGRSVGSSECSRPLTHLLIAQKPGGESCRGRGGRDVGLSRSRAVGSLVAETASTATGTMAVDALEPEIGSNMVTVISTVRLGRLRSAVGAVINDG